MLKKYFANKNFIAGGALIFLLALICLISFAYTPYPPNAMDSLHRFAPPGRQFLFGTDNFGRDILSRIMMGSRTAFFVGFSSVALSMASGVLVGAVSGYFGGVLDSVATRLIDLVMTFPTVLFALMLIAVFGGGTKNLIIVLGVSLMPRFARLTRAGYMQAKKMEYVKSARMKGAGPARIMFYHILPNITSPLVVNASFSFSLSVMTEAALSYLGLGVQPPDPSWGRMFNEAQPFLQQAPWYVLFTGIPLVVMVLGFNLLGDGVNEVQHKK